MIMQYKVIGTETGKLICTGRHSDCIRTINQKISRWSKSSAHLEPLQILPIDEEYIQVIDECIEILEPGYNTRGAYKRKDAKKI